MSKHLYDNFTSFQAVMMKYLLVLFLSFMVISAKAEEEKPLPRFAFLKSNEVNVRIGPTREHDIAFKYREAGLPVEITAEYENWRRIRDWEGAEGWVQNTLLASQKRHVYTANVKEGEVLNVYASPDLKGKTIAVLEPKVSAIAKKCTKKACLIEHKEFSGWIDQNKLWGVYPDEVF